MLFFYFSSYAIFFNNIRINMKNFVFILICFTFIACSDEKNEPVVLTKTDTVYIEKNVNQQDVKDQNTIYKQNIEKTNSVNYSKVEKKNKETPNPYINSKIEFKIINSENSTFGYDISIDGRTSIHQPSIPECR